MRPYLCQRQAALVAPAQKPQAGAAIGATRVRVADVGAEKFGVAPRCTASPRSAISAGTTICGVARSLAIAVLRETGTGSWSVTRFRNPTA